MKRAMTREDAAALLELPAVHDEATVRFCYGNAIRADHPDHGGTGTRLTLIREARDVMLQQDDTKKVDVPPCTMCRGTGSVRGRFGVRPCVACDGTGDRS